MVRIIECLIKTLHDSAPLFTSLLKRSVRDGLIVVGEINLGGAIAENRR